MSIYEYLLLERGFKSKGVEKFFAMNVVVEGFALGLFGMMSTLPGLEILRLFHRDESRHTALPANYLKEFPLTKWQQRNPFAQARRLSLILPLVPAVALGEEDLAELGIDAFDFAGATRAQGLPLVGSSRLLSSPSPHRGTDIGAERGVQCRRELHARRPHEEGTISRPRQRAVRRSSRRRRRSSA